MFWADVARSVFSEVETEPQLLPLQDENLNCGRTANRSHDARVDLRVRGFWTRQQEAFFDIRVTHPKADLLTRSQTYAQLEKNEREKKRQYNQRIVNADCGVFTPLVFSTFGMVGRECSTFLKTLVSAFVEKNKDLGYAHVMNTLRSKLAFCLLRWNVTRLRGCRTSYNRRQKSDFATECRLATST